MRKNSLIDDVEMSDFDKNGPPILFQNPEIRKMLKLAKAKEEDIFYDLIIMGSRGLGAFKELLLGSVSFKVMHHAKCPVMIVR